VLAALVLDCIGVERTAIVEDYVLTATRMELIIGRVRRDPLVGDRVDEIPASAFAVLATSMERFLEGSTSATAGPVSGRSTRACRPTTSTSSRCSWSNRIR